MLSRLAAIAVAACLALPASVHADPPSLAQKISCDPLENCLIGQSGPSRPHGWSSPRLAPPRSEYRQPGPYLDLGVQSPRTADPDYRMGRPRYVQPPNPYKVRVTPAHVDWCSMRYRSYRPQDNTFQPFNGPRRQCFSPYS